MKSNKRVLRQRGWRWKGSKDMRVKVGNIEIVCDIDGPGDAPVILLSHCFGTHRGLWAAQVPALIEAGYRVLSYDARGHGESDAPDGSYSFELMANDIVGLMDALEIHRVHFCGISMSGMIGQHVGLLHGHRLHSLTLSNTTSAFDDGQRQVWTDRLTRIAAEGVAPLHDVMMARWFTPESLERRPPGVDLMHASTLDYPKHLFVTICELVRDIATTERLHEITVPTLIIAGALDAATTPTMSEEICARIQNSEMVVIEGAGHISPVERPQAFNTALLEFLSRQKAGIKN